MHVLTVFCPNHPAQQNLNSKIQCCIKAGAGAGRQFNYDSSGTDSPTLLAGYVERSRLNFPGYIQLITSSVNNKEMCQIRWILSGSATIGCTTVPFELFLVRLIVKQLFVNVNIFLFFMVWKCLDNISLFGICSVLPYPRVPSVRVPARPGRHRQDQPGRLPQGNKDIIINNY